MSGTTNKTPHAGRRASGPLTRTRPGSHVASARSIASARGAITSAILSLAIFTSSARAADDADAPVLFAQNVAPTEHFVPRPQSRVANLEIRGEATIYGSEVTLRQVCGWPEADDAAMADLADLVLLRMPPGAAQASLSIDQVRQILHDAGVSLATINFAGAITCTVTRSDVAFDEQKALEAWARREDPTVSADGATVQPTLALDAVTRQGQRLHEATTPDAPRPAVIDNRSLRSILVNDLATRLKLPADTLQIDFRPEDRAFLDLAESQFAFKVEVQRGNALGEWRWLVSTTSGAAGRRVQVVATVRAWQDQVLVTRPIAFRQEIAADSVERRRVLVERLGSDAPVRFEAVVGNAAARDLQPGTVLTGRMISPVELARPGQLVTVVMRRGGVEIRTVATALQPGSYGQTIRVKNDQTRQQFDVQLIAPQMAVSGDAVAVADPTSASARE